MMMKLGRNNKRTAETVRIDLIAYRQTIRTFMVVLKLFNNVFDSGEHKVQCHAAAVVGCSSCFVGGEEVTTLGQ